MPGSLVFVDQSLADRFVDHRYRFLVSGLGSFRITGGNGFNDIFDMGAQHRALAGFALTADFRLTGAFTGLCRVCQNISPVPGSKEPATMRISRGIVNDMPPLGAFLSRKLVKSTAVVGVMTLISRVLGLVRDMVFARFGVDAGMDAFFVAFKIPNFMRRLFAEGAFSQAFVPVLSEYKTHREQAEVKALVDRVAGTLLGMLGLLVLAGVLASPLLVMVFAPGFWSDPLKFDLTAYMLRFTFPYLLFMALVAFAAGILNSYGRFAAAAFTPVWLNVVLDCRGAAGRAQSGTTDGCRVLGRAAGGFCAAGISVAVAGANPSRCRDRAGGWRDAGVRKILKLMVPGIIGSSVSQINLLFDTLLASFLVTGSVSWLYYADRLVEFPLGIFGIALATVILPVSVPGPCQRTRREEFSRTLDAGLRWVLLIGLPAAAGLIILARPAVSTLFRIWRFPAPRCADGRPGTGRLRHRVARIHAGEDTRAGVFFPPGHQNAGKGGDSCHDRQYGDECGVCGSAGAARSARRARGSGAGDGAGQLS